MAHPSVHLLLNTKSRRSRDSIPAIEAALTAQHIRPTAVHHVTATVSLAECLLAVKKARPQLLIVGGGDGTVSDVVDQLVGSDIELGIIPLGTTNNFARSLKVPLTIEAAVKTIALAQARPVDLGKVGDDYFANVTGIGISALIAKHVTNKRKKRFGRLAYALVGFEQLHKHKPFIATLQDKDSELAITLETHQIIVANGRYHAGKQIAKDARLDNRELVIFALGGRRKLSFLWHTLDYYIGKRKHVAHTSYFIGKNIRVTTNRPQPVELDGENKYTTPLAIEVVPQAIKVRY